MFAREDPNHQSISFDCHSLWQKNRISGFGNAKCILLNLRQWEKQIRFKPPKISAQLWINGIHLETRSQPTNHHPTPAILLNRVSQTTIMFSTNLRPPSRLLRNISPATTEGKMSTPQLTLTSSLGQEEISHELKLKAATAAAAAMAAHCAACFFSQQQNLAHHISGRVPVAFWGRGFRATNWAALERKTQNNERKRIKRSKTIE